MHDVKCEFFGEVAVVRGGEGGGGIGGDADLAGALERGVAFEGDDVGRGRIVKKIVVNAGESGVGEDGEGEFAWRDGCWDRRVA